MKHKHHDVIVAWADDTSKVVQWSEPGSGVWKDIIGKPQWDDETAYRIKPETPPDVVCTGLFGTYSNGILCYHVSSGANPNLRLTFDGETGKLKSAEVL